MDNKSTTKRMIGAVVLVLIAALLLAWLLKGKNPKLQQNQIATAQQTQQVQPISGFPGVAADPNALPPAPSGPSAPPALVADAQQMQAAAQAAAGANEPVAAPNADLQTTQAPTPENVATFDIRPGETRAAIDKNGNAVETVGSMGGDAVVAQGANTDENQPAPSNAVTNETGNVAPDAATAEVAAPEAQPKSLVESAQATANEAAAGAAAATAQATNAATQGAKQAKEVLVAKPNVTATNPAVKPVTISAANPKPVQPRLVNERPVPESAARSSNNANSAKVNAAPKKPEEVAKTSATQKVPTVEALTAEAAKREGYVIQVLATSDRGKADTIRQTIATDGYPAFIAQGVANGKRVYRVRIGTYRAKSDAVSVQSRMKARYAQNQLVQNSFVTNNN